MNNISIPVSKILYRKKAWESKYHGHEILNPDPSKFTTLSDLKL